MRFISVCVMNWLSIEFIVYPLLTVQFVDDDPATNIKLVACGIWFVGVLTAAVGRLILDLK